MGSPTPAPPQQGCMMGSGSSRPPPLVGVALSPLILRLQLLAERDWRSWKLLQGWKRGCYLPACDFVNMSSSSPCQAPSPGMMLGPQLLTHLPEKDMEAVMTGRGREQTGRRHPQG